MRVSTKRIALGTVFHALATVAAFAQPGTLQLTIGNPTSFAGDNFGAAVASLGTTVAAGAPGDDAGAADSGVVHLFDGTATGTTSTADRTIQNPDAIVDGAFGSALAALGSNLIVGAPGNFVGGVAAGAVYLVDPSDGSTILTIQNPTPIASDLFGAAVAAVGANILIGAPGDDTGAAGAGSAYVFDGTVTGTTNTPLLTINHPVGVGGAALGTGIVGIGTTAFVGAPFDFFMGRPGAVYGFDATATGTTSTPAISIQNPSSSMTMLEAFGFALADLGGDLLVGAPGNILSMSTPGRAYVFDATGTPLERTFSKPGGSASDNFGHAVAGAESGTLALIGAPGDDTGPATDAGAADLMNPISGASALPTFFAPMPVTGDNFGSAVAAADGFRSVVGAPGRSSGAGQVFVFEGTVPVEVSGFEID